MRLFVGIALADAVRNDLKAMVARLRSNGGAATAGLRWTAPESWHITLQFLGSATPEQLACLTTRLGAVRAAPVPVELGALGCFERTGVLFADVHAAPELAALADRVAAATGGCGWIAETRPFHPHITLARKTGSERARAGGSNRLKTAGRGCAFKELVTRAAAMPPFSRFTAREFLLYESHLSAEGARYEERARFPLGSE